mgnify:CR=1 FL=1
MPNRKLVDAGRLVKKGERRGTRYFFARRSVWEKETAGCDRCGFTSSWNGFFHTAFFPKCLFYRMRPQVCEYFLRHNLRLLIDDEVTAVRLDDAVAARHEGFGVRH